MLIAKLNEQVACAQAQQGGSVFAPTRIRTVKDQESGESKRVEMPQRVKPWWFTDDSGKLCLVVKYGTKPLQLAKGKVAIELTTQAGWSVQYISVALNHKSQYLCGFQDKSAFFGT
jgi:hypothetical protein